VGAYPDGSRIYHTDGKLINYFAEKQHTAVISVSINREKTKESLVATACTSMGSGEHWPRGPSMRIRNASSTNDI
jgi:hypothetical protein